MYTTSNKRDDHLAACSLIKQACPTSVYAGKRLDSEAKPERNRVNQKEIRNIVNDDFFSQGCQRHYMNPHPNFMFCAAQEG
jgi:hypothetical protein